MRLDTSRLTLVFGTGLQPVRLVRSENGRQVWQARDHRGRRLTLVRARTLRAVNQVRREIALLRALEAGNISAVPSLKWRGFAAYAFAEGPSALAPPRGKRAARSANTRSGGTVAEMASDLAVLLKALHSRNLTLGLPGFRGLELSPRGRVVVTDFSHVAQLRPVKKRGDEQWLARLTSGAGTYRYAQRKAEELEEWTWEAGSEAPAAVCPTLSGRGVPAGAALRQGKGKPGRNRPRTRSKRSLTFVAVAALACTVLVGGAMRASTPQLAPSEAAAVPAERNDPVEIITALAHARHRYLTGKTELNDSAVPGSEAELADRKLRAALEGVQVEGGEVRVLEAHTLEQSENDARVRARLKDTPARMGEGVHSLELDQSRPYEVDIRLERIAGSWRIASTTPVGEGGESA